MAFKLNLSDRYFWPVTATVPANGKKDQIKFDGEFMRLTQSEISELNNKELTFVEVAKQVLVGWKGVQDEHGKEIEFSESMRDTLLDIPGMPVRIVQCWGESIQQGDEKN